MKQQQIQQGDIAAQNANELRALYEAHKAAKTPEERSLYEEAIRVRTGKDNKLQVVDLGSESVPDGMGGVKAIPRGQEVIDPNTKQWIQRPGSAQARATNAPSYEDYAKQIKAKNAGITDEQIRAGYAKNFGGK